MYDITYSIYVTSYPLYLWHHIHYVWQHNTVCCWCHTWHMCDIICNTDYITSTLSYITSCICVVIPTLSMILQPAYVWYHIEYTCYILYTIFMTSYPLCMTTQHCVLLLPHGICVTSFALQMISHPLYHAKWQYLWFHMASGMTSHPLYEKSHPLYLCHHNLSTDIIPTFGWHHTHYMCDIIFILYNIISTPYVITLLCYDITASIYETTSTM